MTPQPDPGPEVTKQGRIVRNVIDRFDLIGGAGRSGRSGRAGRRERCAPTRYLLTATILPAVAVVPGVLSARNSFRVLTTAVRRVGLRIAVIGLLGLVVDAIVTMASGSTDNTGPLYPISTLASLIGIVLIAIQWYRAGRLPSWTGPTVAAAWFLGATPILGTDGAFLILAAAFLAIAAGVRRETAARLTAPVSVDSSVTA